MTERYLLDTCAIIWISQNEAIADAATAALAQAETVEGAISVSLMSAWELGMLVSKGRLPATRAPDRWFEEFVQTTGSNVAGLSPQILVASSFLPKPIHNDPMDRILIATARENDLTLVTRDRAILAYGKAGHVKTLAC